MDVEIRQESSYKGDDLWNWSIWLEGSDNALDAIAHVVYTLHQSFPNPVRTISDRATRFRLSDQGWSTFKLYVEIVAKDGSVFHREKEVQLLYPDEISQIGSAVETDERSILAHIISSNSPKKLLAIDGGGIRSVMTIEVLAKMEAVLRTRMSDPALILADYFDYIGGTSTGAIIASCLSLGFSVDELMHLYLSLATDMFDKAQLWERFRSKYSEGKFAARLKELFGEDTVLGSSRLRTLFMTVVRNATTDNSWFLTNNPKAKYNDPTRADCHLRIPLWQIVRASTAAPTYFPPEVIRIGGREFILVDGGISVYNNPSFQLFLMASSKPYRLEWSTGENSMLLVSVGSGAASAARDNLTPGDMNLVYNAASIPSALMSSASIEQDLLCRMLGMCRQGPPIDMEVGDLLGGGGPKMPKLFSYLRYQFNLDQGGLDSLGLADIRPESVQSMDRVDHVPELQTVGRAYAARNVVAEHFKGFDRQVP